jgi:transcriptional regulator with XRE-family HTH domain
MTAKKHFGIKDKGAARQPLQYRACGLDDVYLVNGFTITESDGEEVISVENIEDLHEAIAVKLITSPAKLKPAEFKFLRNNMDLTQAELGERLGVDVQAIGRYERNENENGIPPPVDQLLRFHIVLHLLPKDEREELLAKVEEAAKEHGKIRGAPACFRLSNDEWKRQRLQ